MAYYKRLFIILLLFILFLNLFQNFGFCVEVEDVSFDVVSGIHIRPDQNYFSNQIVAGEGVAYFTLEKGYIYHIHNNTTGYYRYLALSSGVPQANLTYTFLATISAGETYSYMATNNETLYFDFSSNQNVTVTREKVVGLDTSVHDLVENVGPNALWGVFGSGIDFVFVVVIVAFGIFIIVKLIKGLSKGKSKI